MAQGIARTLSIEKRGLIWAGGGGSQPPGSMIHVVLLNLAGAEWPPLPERTNRPEVACGEPSTSRVVSEYAVFSTVGPPLGHASTARAGQKPHFPPMEQIDRAIKDIRIASGRDLTQLFTPASGVWRDIRKLRPAGQKKRSPGRPGRNDGFNNVMTDGIAGAYNSSARVLEEVINSGMHPVDEVDSFHS